MGQYLSLLVQWEGFSFSTGRNPHLSILGQSEEAAEEFLEFVTKSKESAIVVSMKTA